MIPKAVSDLDNGILNWSILTAYRGSIAHEMYVPKTDPDSIDDKDVISVCVPPPEYFLGLQQYGKDGTKEVKVGEWDIVIYEVRKMFRLLEKGNPNVLSLLWTDETKMLKMTAAGRLLIEQS